MRIAITKNLILRIQGKPATEALETIFPPGEYPAVLTPEGTIEVSKTSNIKALFSFSQFREKISFGEIVVLEN
jgi:hypothetical protein